MDWLEPLAACVQRELDHRGGPLNLTINELRVLATTEAVPDACYWWASLEPYLAFGMRGIEVETYVRGMIVSSITFRLKTFSFARHESSDSLLVLGKRSELRKRRLPSDGP